MAGEAPPLAGVRMVEWAEGLAGSFAGFLLAALGADVVTIEAAGARRTSAASVLQRGKRSVDAACWDACVRGADVTLTDEAGPAVEAGDGLIACRVIAWGDAGAPRGLPPEEPLIAAMTGVQAMQWSWAGRPVWLVTSMISYMTGMLAALGVVGALFARRRGAPGQAVRVSQLDGAFALNSGTYVTGPDHTGRLLQGGDPRGVYPTYGLYRTADGWLFVGALTQRFWVKLMMLLERVDLLADPRLQTNPLAFGSPEIRSFVRAALEPMFRARTTTEWLHALGDADIPCGAVESREQFLSDPDARALGLVVPVEDPVHGPTWQPAGPAAFSDTPAPAPRPASLPRADTEAVRAEVAAWRRGAASAVGPSPRACLDGVRVLDLTNFIAGPVCPMLLADLGADVVKIESAEGDPFRLAAFAFLGWNRGKRALVLDLKRAEGREVFLDLARQADVVVDNFRAGVMERLGLGWETLHDVNPRLVHTSITGYGSSGRLATRPGFDPVFQARSGLMQAQGGEDEPVFHMIAYTDYSAGTLGALATLAALFARERTGHGQRVDVSLFRTAFVAQAADMILHQSRVPAGRGGRDYLGPGACRRLYACRDGWLCITARTEAEAAALGRLAGMTVALSDPPDGAAAEGVARALATASRAEALDRLAAAGVPAAPCLGFAELFSDPFLRESGCLAEQNHPTLGRVRMGGPVIRFAATPIVYRRPASLLGADGEEVLREVGYTPEQIAALMDAGVVGRPLT